MIGLHRLVRDHAGALEADLQRFYGVDVRDRWHPDRRRRLTLRRIGVLVRHLPVDAALARVDDQPGMVWRLEHHLLDDIRQSVNALAAKPRPHPQRPQPRMQQRRDSPERRRRLAAARRRARDRRAAIDAGEIV